jgi:predicted NUDIX family phosphoesterase
MCVDSRIFYGIRKNNLIRGPLSVNYLNRFRKEHEWIERDEALENNKNYRQVIPYCLVQHSETGLFLLSKRTDKQQEKRLHNKYSIGIGGHIEQGEYTHCPIETTSEKELLEETGCCIGHSNSINEFQGIILSDGKDIDDVHVGCLYHVITSENELTNEDGKHEHQWANMRMLLHHYNDMESWSKIVFDDYINAI